MTKLLTLAPLFLLLFTTVYMAVLFQATVRWYDERLSEQAHDLAVLNLQFRGLQKAYVA